MARKQSSATDRKGRIDLAAALRWAARLGLNEGVCNHFSLALAPDRYLINPQGLHWSEVCVADMLLVDGQGQVLEGRHPIEPSAFSSTPGSTASTPMHGWCCTPTCRMPRR